MRTLLKWRSICRGTCIAVTAELRRSLYRMLEKYIPCPRELLRVFTDCHAVIGGLFALAYILRDRSLCPSTLDVYTDSAWFQPVLEYLSYSPFLSPYVYFDGVTVPPGPFKRHRNIRRRAYFITDSGKRLCVNESRVAGACSPIGSSWTTALMNFVTASTIACAYPHLILARKSFVSDLALESMEPSDYEDLITMVQHNFTFTVDPSEWPDCSAKGGADGLVEYVIPCHRRLFLCPGQGRYFGDRGSLFVFIDPLCDSYSTAYHQRRPPYGYMIAWRLWTSFACEDACIERDEILPAGIITMPIMLVLQSQCYGPIGHNPSAAHSQRYSDAIVNVRRSAVRPRSKTI
ncbi:hypothetical protein C8Q76DRAFT_630272 [Earliella scabrosa]|nr:hypothetical protein C8Q76DRAFT_630272 [Earliella scabrosa]